ncbi:hypothetical protein CHS0354_007080 [Potamilus streckersoni]|uniref:Uncharacterized protein n=1 Tax=Potamilus streckersoni TaxID=2493646 RepID=A0AAE0RYF5_9BIVA|nr:hypothetical protein CHS0354_007080 [Potamilus streckersoni]
MQTQLLNRLICVEEVKEGIKGRDLKSAPGPDEIKLVSSSDAMIYFGGLFDPWAELLRVTPDKQLEDLCHKIDRAAFKSRQKVRVLSECFIPKLLFGQSLGYPVKSTLKKLHDVAKAWTHLPECTSNHFIY